MKFLKPKYNVVKSEIRRPARKGHPEHWVPKYGIRRIWFGITSYRTASGGWTMRPATKLIFISDLNAVVDTYNSLR